MFPHSSVARFGTGIEFRESGLVIGPKCSMRTAKGQVYHVSLGLSDLTNPEAKESASKKYSFFIGDTVLVNEASTQYANPLPQSFA